MQSSNKRYLNIILDNENKFHKPLALILIRFQWYKFHPVLCYLSAVQKYNI